MKIIWLGHGSFRIEVEDQVLLIDPWLDGNPSFPADQLSAATEGATAILVTHGHFDHVGGLIDLAKKNDLTVAGVYDLVSWWESSEGLKTIPFHRGGTITFGAVSVTMVPASHSSSLATDHGPMYAGNPAGFMVQGEGKTLYHSGDTDVMADMEWMGDYYKPEIGILSAGGHFTMDMRAAAYAAKRYFDFETVIPCHYKTFPILAQSAEDLVAGLPGVNVIEPVVMEAIEL